MEKADGELLGDLVSEYGFNSTRDVWQRLRTQQLSGTYVAKFNAPQIGIVNLEVPVPAVPEVISPELAERVKTRRDNNPDPRRSKRRPSEYVLSGFIRCERCGAQSLSQNRRGLAHFAESSEQNVPVPFSAHGFGIGSKLAGVRYQRHRHYRHPSGIACVYHWIRADILEPAVLDCDVFPLHHDWQTLPFEAVQRLLHSLFWRRGGIFVDRTDDKWRITLRGPEIGTRCVERPVESRYRGLKSYPYHKKSPSPAAD